MKTGSRWQIAAFIVGVLASTWGAGANAQSCKGDLNDDQSVNGVDLGMLLAAWGPGPAPADLTGDGFVNGDDLGVLLASWGSCPPVPHWATLIEMDPNPAVVADPQLRAAISATGWAWRVRHTATQIEMLLIPPGSFQMGCSASLQTACLSSESPIHSVTLTRPTYMSRYEVTQAQWVAQMGSNPAVFVGQPDSPSRPVEHVSWNMVVGFSAATGLRLPTEAEWEFACRAGTSTAFSNGSDDEGSLYDVAWFGSCCDEGNSGGQTRPVGLKPPNGLGLHDTHGNVWEWVSDGWGTYSASPQTNPAGPSMFNGRVARGGSFLSPGGSLRSSYRASSNSDGRFWNTGFRVARDP